MEWLSRVESARPLHRLDVGDPDVPPPPELLQALARPGRLGYGPPEGLPEFREAVAEVFGVEPSEVVAVAGARHGLAALMWHFRKARLMTPRPYYPGYLEIAEVFDIGLQVVDGLTDRGVYVVNYPNNPTGAVLPRDRVKELVDVAEFVISDEIYRDIVFTEFTSPLQLGGNVAVVYSFSKVFSVPGLRIGAVVAPRDLARAVARFNRATVNTPPVASQRAVLAALGGLRRRSAEVSGIYRRRAEAALAALRLPAARPGGAFYLFPRAAPDCAERALERGVSVMPGALYGAPRHVRIALVEPEERLVEAIQAVNEACAPY